MMAEKEEDITEGEETGPPDQFVGRDPLESYIYWLNYEWSNPLARYEMLIKRITFGMELLPEYNDPTETDPDKQQFNKEKQDEINSLYAKAAELLKTEISAKRKVTYDYVDHGGERTKLYKIRAVEDKDAGEYQVLEKDLKTGMDNFITQQHEQHTSKLQEVHTKIFHELTQTGIVPSIDPSANQLVEGEAKAIFRMINQMLEEGNILPSTIAESDENGRKKR